MGKHEWHRGRGSTATQGRRWREGILPDPHERAVVEPDRGLAGTVPGAEHDAREHVHTDRDPEDDIHLAAARPQQTEYEGDTGSDDTGGDDSGYADTGSDDSGYADTGDDDSGYADTGSDDTGSDDASYADSGYADEPGYEPEAGHGGAPDRQA